MLMPALMKRVNLLILSKDESKVMRALGRLKLIHFEPTQGDILVPLQEKDGRGKPLERSRRLLMRIDEIMADFGVKADGPAEEGPHLTSGEISAKLRDIDATRREIRRQVDHLAADDTQLATMIRDLQAFTGLGIPMERLNDFSFLHFAVGNLPATSMAELNDRVGGNVVLLPHRGEDDAEQLVAVTSKKGRFALETELERVGFQPEAVGPERKGLADDLVHMAEERRATNNVQKDLAEKLRIERAQDFGPLLRAFRRTVANEIRIIEAQANFAYTEAACYINGWVPAAQVNDMTEAVLEATDGRVAIEVTDPAPDSEPPSKFRQGSLLRPFTMLVSGYGFPKYREIEPTLFVAITFMAMFGFMFGDVGQGAVLVAAGLLLKARARKEKVGDVGVILVACGLAAVAMGFVYGSYFGMSHETMSWLPRAAWHEPVAGARTIETLEISVVGGAVLISLGLVFNIVNRVRRRDWAHGIFDKFGLVGALMYWAVLWLAVKALVFGTDDLPVTTVLWIMALGVGVLFIREPLLVFLKRRRGEQAESLAEAIITAFIEVMEVFISYLANSLSFLRLAAYAMSHFALLLATMEMSKVLRDMGPAGNVAAVIVFILGNAVIIVLEGMIAAIQAIRLEYYEFFGKFYSGTGRAYKPFEAE